MSKILNINFDTKLAFDIEFFGLPLSSEDKIKINNSTNEQTKVDNLIEHCILNELTNAELGIVYESKEKLTVKRQKIIYDRKMI